MDKSLTRSCAPAFIFADTPERRYGAFVVPLLYFAPYLVCAAAVTLIARIVDMVENAENNKAKAELPQIYY
ncbi:hypothetical protein FACS1894206_04740 [Deltaproteobacteria bacterium]|nr:hypothetical protein FACS1894206_04740 [Deltaproteobacteria bacterium]